jgi:hypothetical protein
MPSDLGESDRWKLVRGLRARHAAAGGSAMRITKDSVRGPVLRMQSSSRANLIDTAELYEPEPSERLIAQALHPYPGLFALNPESAARSLGRFRPRG